MDFERPNFKNQEGGENLNDTDIEKEPDSKEEASEKEENVDINNEDKKENESYEKEEEEEVSINKVEEYYKKLKEKVENDPNKEELLRGIELNEAFAKAKIRAGYDVESVVSEKGFSGEKEGLYENILREYFENKDILIEELDTVLSDDNIDILERKDKINEVWKKFISWGDKRAQELCSSLNDENIYYQPFEEGKDGGDSWYIREFENRKVGCVIDTGGKGQGESYKKYFMSYILRLAENLPLEKRDEYIKEINNFFYNIHDKREEDIKSFATMARAEISKDNQEEKTANISIFGDAGVIIYNTENYNVRTFNCCQLNDISEIKEENINDLDIKSNPPIGIIPNIEDPVSSKISLEKNDKIILFSDGLTQQRDSEGRRASLALREIQKYSRREYENQDLGKILINCLKNCGRTDDTTFLVMSSR